MRLFTEISGIYEDTITIACTDLVQQFSNAQLINSNSNLPMSCLICAEGHDVRFAFGITNPTQGVDGSGAIGHILYAGQSILISNTRSIQQFKFINHENGQNAIIQVSMSYNIGD